VEQRRGALQAHILRELTAGAATLKQIVSKRAAALIDERL
jgi:hypothetical protein